MSERLRKFRGGAASLLALALAGCMGGTGTDTENGLEQPVLVLVRVVSAGSVPVASVRLEVNEMFARADSSAENPVLEEDTASLTTDTWGYASFRLKKRGAFVTQGSFGDSILFIDTLRTEIVRDGIVHGGPGNLFEAREPLRATGRVRLLSGYRADSGHVTLQGTKLLWKLDEDGSFDLGWLPPEAESMTLRVVYRASPTDSSLAPSCVKPGHAGTNSAVLRIAEGEILVNDVIKSAVCVVGLP